MSKPVRAPRGTPRSSKKPLLLAAAAAVLLLVAVLAPQLLPERTQPSQEESAAETTPEVIAEFEGEGDERTPTFQVEEGWQVHWSSDGGSFEMDVIGDPGLGTLVTDGGQVSGVASPVPAGQFALDIRAEGPWTARVLQVD